MGFLGKLFGGEKELPPLDPASPGAKRIDAQRATLETFAAKLRDPVEIAPGPHAIYAYIGHPPDRFGIAWFEGDGQEHNLKTLVQKKKLTVLQVNKLSAHLRTIYEKHKDEPRYGLTIGTKKVKVVLSTEMEKELHDVINADVGTE